MTKVRNVSQFSALMLVSLYSYHVRELQVCWLFFTALFAALAFLVLTGALACFAGKYDIHLGDRNSARRGGGART